MLWVLKRTVSMRRFSEHPKHVLKLCVRKCLQFYTEIFCLAKLMKLMKLVIESFEIIIMAPYMTTSFNLYYVSYWRVHTGHGVCLNIFLKNATEGFSC